MLDPEPAGRTPPTHATPPSVLGSTGETSPHALQILMTEHWSLLGTRSMGYVEAMARASMFIAALSGGVVALALVAQATDFGDPFVAFSLVLLPVVFFLGVVTIVRLTQVGWEDAVWIQGMNRIRNAYLELAPELEPYFVTSRHDDAPGIMLSSIARTRMPGRFQALVAIPGVVAVLDSVVAGAVFGIGALALDAGTATSIVIGAAAFVLSIAGFIGFGARAIAAYRRSLVARFPTPPGPG